MDTSSGCGVWLKPMVHSQLAPHIIPLFYAHASDKQPHVSKGQDQNF